MRVTIRDIANKLNISDATVSKVLNDRHTSFISEGMRRKVLNAAREMGYRPNYAARALATGRTHTICLWTPYLGLAFYNDVAYHVSEQSRAHGYLMVMYDVREAMSDDDNVPLPVLLSAVDGMLTFDVLEEQSALRERFGLTAPMVSMGVYCSREGDFVGVDLMQGVTEAVQHLMAPGCRRVAYLLDSASKYEGDTRYDTYMRVLGEAGLPAELIEIPSQSRQDARQGIKEYIRSAGCPEALLCVNDDVAIGAYRGLCDLGIHIPEDVALVGCDGIVDTEYFPCSISTIAQPVEAMCALGWEFLEKRMNTAAAPAQQALLSAQLLVRESSRRA